MLAPHHTLGHAGGAAGVQDVEVVGCRLDRWEFGRRRGKRFFVVDGSGEEGVVRSVGHLEQHHVSASSGNTRSSVGANEAW